MMTTALVVIVLVTLIGTSIHEAKGAYKSLTK